MEQKTKVNAEEGKQDLVITREFDLPLELLFKAYAEAEIVEQWMGTKVQKLENKKHGSWHYITSDPQGNPVFQANGVFHEFSPNKKITRTFEMENAPFGVQLEFLEFIAVSEDTSRLNIHIVYESVEHRDGMIKIGMGKGMSMAHDRLEKIVGQLKVK
ncbi:SRPBCC domain-containing protein [Chitinophaga sp. S165]|uniref:SRPBCC domain-containing protein n=1 Tax=Chitinophaga sp. S165 TaxID=2135462 RepID=UPI000D718A9F|nr:SRPBCC domain-containing protein [Chitinophaga sp. S165]PWV56275.1 uncharacterized protein YndB with AHSA1/START domain [Chitinophaga sp. S165]